MCTGASTPSGTRWGGRGGTGLPPPPHEQVFLRGQRTCGGTHWKGTGGTQATRQQGTQGTHLFDTCRSSWSQWAQHLLVRNSLTYTTLLCFSKNLRRDCARDKVRDTVTGEGGGGGGGAHTECLTDVGGVGEGHTKGCNKVNLGGWSCHETTPTAHSKSYLEHRCVLRPGPRLAAPKPVPYDDNVLLGQREAGGGAGCV